MSESLFRAIVGPISPIPENEEAPLPYRRTLPVPPAPVNTGTANPPSPIPPVTPIP